ncbi:DUF2855 family protein [Sulfitobacter guttiformis]|uniref:Uncharacterized protein DUF2855 n=1 Tax=Sulfitobacter guttiformis TaxID=74349 RepID=A0A420DI52_9RHOB|nr:DUF2855 family protein [Sulfitobacter guttiformis]KIN72369.1 DUF2855 domain containing protein [Sulfitobacter guttiformis KCTC 32187]RKE93875.1 uncharacterized protein DUF2855 [Sulfitobacter guttiformis]
MQRLLTNHKTITETRIEDVAAADCSVGQARLKLESFALTANNVTYAASGFAIGYWNFFPTGIEGYGLVPVWGTAVVSESNSPDIAVGTRLYGFYPLAEELVIEVQADGYGGFVDASAHRAKLPAVYNRYTPVRQSGPSQDHMRALLQPLLATSYLLFDWLTDNDRFGAEQIIIGSASSKTGLGLCKYLAEPKDRDYKIIGLTSDKNRSFVEDLGACDLVLTYDEIGQLPLAASVYVDMSGNAGVKAQVHSTLGAHLKHSAAVGISHWDQFAPQTVVEGVKPQFFFAPAQIAKRRDEWGPGVIEKQITQAWKRLADDAGTWLDVKVHDGLGQAASIYGTLADGSANPRHGHIISL